MRGLKYEVWGYFVFIYGAGVEPSALLLRPFIGLLYQPWLIYSDDYGAIGGMNEWQGKPKCSEKTHASAVLSTTDLTRFDPGSKSGHCGGKPATYRPRYSTGREFGVTVKVLLLKLI
jgi:hypothetical protein